MARKSMLLSAAVVALGAVLAPWAPSRSATADVRIDRTPQFVDEVGKAIERGVEWLRSQQRRDGSFPELGGNDGAITALSLYTLKACGVSRDDPAATKALAAMRHAYQALKRRKDQRTYTIALMCMALAEEGPQRAPAKGTSDRGAGGPAPDELAWLQEMADWFQQTQTADGAWSYPHPGRAPAEPYDHSNTQYALLGLKAASRGGAKVRAATWLKSLRHFLDAQDPDGPDVPRFEPVQKGRTDVRVTDRARGWGYMSRSTSYGSMTAGGVSSVVICRSELIGRDSYPASLDTRAEQSARDGIAWLGRRFSVTTNPGPAGTMAGMGWHYYHLYGLERAGVLAGVEWMGDHDWYGEGARYLLDAQLGSGAWLEGTGRGRRGGMAGDAAQAILSTSFALLFLKKGTLPVARGALTRSIDESDINFAAAPSLSDADFEDFLDLVLSRWARVGDGAAKERILAAATAVGPRIVPSLVLRLDSTRDAEREASHALLLRATGQDFGYDPLVPADLREHSAVKWQAWWLANAGGLRYDAGSGRLVAAP